MKYTRLAAAVLATTLCLPTLSFATNGYLLHGYGKNKGTGGAGIANPQDAIAAGTNPAGTVWVGNRFDLFGEFFNPRRGYDFDGDPTLNVNDALAGNINAGDAFAVLGSSDKVNSEKDVFLIPAMGFTHKIDDVSAWGISVYGAGLGSHYNHDDTSNNVLDSAANIGGNQVNLGNILRDSGVNPNKPGLFFDGTAGVDLLLVMTNINYSRKITENASWGLGVILAFQSFKAYGLGAFDNGALTKNVGFVTDKGRDKAYGYGMNMGIQAELIDGFTVAAAYQTELGLEHEKYKGLFASNGDLSLPRNWTIGMTWKPSRSYALSFDIQRIYWSESPAIGDSFEAFVTFNDGQLAVARLGGPDAAGFGWDDSTVYKLGFQWEMAFLPKWEWRVGYSYQDQIVPGSETLFGTLAPAVIQEHYTFGFSKEFDSGDEVIMNFVYAGLETRRGSGFSQGVDIYLEEYGVEIGYSWNFD